MSNSFSAPIPAFVSFSVPAGRYDSVNLSPTGSATGTSVQAPDDGWLTAGQTSGTKPPVEYFNWMLGYLNNQVGYLRQSGISDWDTRQNYKKGDLIRIFDVSGTAKRYEALSDVPNRQNPITSPIYWKEFTTGGGGGTGYSVSNVSSGTVGILGGAVTLTDSSSGTTPSTVSIGMVTRADGGRVITVNGTYLVSTSGTMPSFTTDINVATALMDQSVFSLTNDGHGGNSLTVSSTNVR